LLYESTVASGRKLYATLRSFDQFGKCKHNLFHYLPKIQPIQQHNNMYKNIKDHNNNKYKCINLFNDYTPCMPKRWRTANIVLEDCVEREFIGKQYGEIHRGLFVIRGENVILLSRLVKKPDRGVLCKSLICG
jgi:small nuclear ribonucleoprotein (snRNP)-like protein